ncbi:MAG: SIMPL domain-containing protein [Gammaproteobacteria bacterium SHHR-1]
MKANPISLQSLLLLPLLLSSLAVQAEETYERIMLAVTVKADVRQERLRAVLFAEEQGLDTARLADAVNQRIALALDLTKNEPGIKARTLGYSSSPIYREQRVEGWRVRQTLELQGDDASALGLLIGKLQSDLNVESINYSISEQQLDTTTEELIDQGLTAFRQRAQRIASGWGRDGYRLVQMAIQSRQNPPPQPMPLQAALARSPVEAVAPPSLQGGEQQVSVTLTGTIELKPDPAAPDNAGPPTGEAAEEPTGEQAAE